VDRILVYGAYGYTGALIAERLVAEGARPILAGRSEERLRPLSGRLGCPSRTFGLDDGAKLDEALATVDLVLHCAGPFSRTAAPMVEACLRTKTHYLDITGEIAVFEALAARGEAAAKVGVMILPGVGFDVVPTDCLAVHLSRKLPDATHLTLAFAGSSTALSHGTTVTSLEQAGRGALRRDGRMTRVSAAWKTMDIDYGGGVTRTSVTIPWGDVVTAFHSTGIPNIEVFAALPPAVLRQIKASRYLGGLLRAGAVQRFLERRVPRGGPDEATRTTAEVLLWGKVTNAAGDSVEARLRTPEAYQTTVLTAVLVARRAARGDAPAGYQTPAKAYGPDLILEIPGAART
jgi:short subunit dehydrogenase-like uncharacterized protein